MKNKYITLLIGITVLASAGCVKPVEPKTLATAESNETMFVIPLQGENKDNQALFDSAAYLNQKKVAAKEIQIPYRWLQTGRWENDGLWIPTVKVIKVDRSPVTVEFAVNDKNEAKKDADAIWVESADSVGFSTGFSVSALINMEDTATFLYRYPAQSLRQVLSTEIRARIQQGAASFASKYPLDSLRAKKNEMVESIRADVVSFYKDRGITITTIGQFGGMTYENPQIQQAIDAVFIAQTAKETAKAQFEAVADTNNKTAALAQQDRINTITLATGEAEAVAKGNLLKSQADAKGIEAVAAATKEAASNPLFLKVRELDVQTIMYNKWNGTVPSTIMGGSGTGVNVFLPHTIEDAAASSTFISSPSK